MGFGRSGRIEYEHRSIHKASHTVKASTMYSATIIFLDIARNIQENNGIGILFRLRGCE
jgi:hypothetical protein